jgi:hypothetical protein
MDPTPKLSHDLALRVLRALNRIRKPSAAEEITEMLNRELDPDDRPFRSKEVAEWLQDSESTTLRLYWLKSRPRR